MKSTSITMSIVLAVAVSSFSTILSQEKSPAVWRKITTFAQKHRGKIITTGLVIIAAALGTVAVGYVNDRAEQAMQQAGIDITNKDHQDYKDAYYYITHYGLFGADKGIELLIKNEDATVLSYIATSKAGKALAIFWGMDQVTLAARLGFKGLGNAVREGVEGVKQGARNVKEKAKKLVDKYF